MRSKQWIKPFFISALLLTASFRSVAFEMKMMADVLTLHAKDTPLRDILAQFQQAGIRVAIDERINPLVSVNFENREIGSGIKRLLADCDYALTWRTINGPAGTFRHIAEIIVYKPGDRRPLTALPAPTPPAIQNQMNQTNSILCLKNELLLRLRPGTTREQLLALLRDSQTTIMNSIPELGLYRLHFPPDVYLADILNRFAKNPLVAQVEPNQIYRSLSPVKTSSSQTDGSPNTRSGESGPAVAILDSGFIPNAALENAVIATLDATAPGTPISDPAGHGTQMAFIASGAINPVGGGLPLDSQSSSIIPIRTMDENGTTSGFTLMQSMIFALDQGARVINMSWGSEAESGFFKDAISYARQRGAVLVAAAGNEPTHRPLYPAALPEVIAVAALGTDGSLWPQSNYGPFVTLAAPGFANLPIGYKGSPGTYGGTSIAAAYTARVVARYFAIHPNATANEAIAALNLVLSRPPHSAPHPEIPHLDTAAVSGFLK